MRTAFKFGVYTFLFDVDVPKLGLTMDRGVGKPPKVKSRGKRNELSRSVGSDGLQSKFGSLFIRTCGAMPPRCDSSLMAFGFISDAVDRLLLDAIFTNCSLSQQNFPANKKLTDRNKKRKRKK